MNIFRVLLLLDREVEVRVEAILVYDRNISGIDVATMCPSR